MHFLELLQIICRQYKLYYTDTIWMEIFHIDIYFKEIIANIFDYSKYFFYSPQKICFFESKIIY